MGPTESGSKVVVTRVVVGSHPGMTLLPLLVSRPGPLFGKDLHIGFPGFESVYEVSPSGSLLLPFACLSPS